MKYLLVALIAACASLTSAQNNAEGNAATDCDYFANYIAKTFNVLRFSSGISYHDSANSNTLFVDTSGDWFLYKLIEGRIYNFKEGKCTYYDNPDGSLMYMMDSFDTVELFDDFNGREAYSYVSDFNGVVIRGVINDLCVENLTFMSVGDKPVTVAVYDSFDLSDWAVSEIDFQISNAISFVESQSCSKI